MSIEVESSESFWTRLSFLLARKHFELGAQQDLHPLLSDDGLKLASENMSQLITGLGQSQLRPSKK